ncbi:putative reverse transcriptase domain-containing protein [Tanacetum coccineum]
MVYCDASHKGLGAVLMQKEKVISLCIATQYPQRKNYTTHDLELGAVVFALKMWRHYLYGTKCTVFTDHKSLQHILDQKELNMRQHRGEWQKIFHPMLVKCLTERETKVKVNTKKPSGLLFKTVTKYGSGRTFHGFCLLSYKDVNWTRYPLWVIVGPTQNPSFPANDKNKLNGEVDETIPEGKLSQRMDTYKIKKRIQVARDKQKEFTIGIVSHGVSGLRDINWYVAKIGTIDDKFNFIEEPVEIMDRKVKQLKQSHIPIVK